VKSISDLETELRLIRSNLEATNGDRDLENSLNKRKEEIENEIRKLKMFVMKKGYSNR
jgi:hypothetical protein